MIPGDPDFSRVTFKVNTAGSWANLVTCDTDRVEEVKAACAIIASGSRVKFKYVDACGGTIEEYGPSHRTGLRDWRAPKGRASW